MAGKRLGGGDENEEGGGDSTCLQTGNGYRGTDARRRLGGALLTAAVTAALPCWCEQEEVGREDVMQRHRGRKTELVA